jgi:hypothetical protein
VRGGARLLIGSPAQMLLRKNLKFKIF